MLPERERRPGQGAPNESQPEAFTSRGNESRPDRTPDQEPEAESQECASKEERPAWVLIGAALNHSGGERVKCVRRPSAVRALLQKRGIEDFPDQWVILGSFEGDRRSRETWRRASGLTLDLDWEDPTRPREEGAHQEIPPGDRERILDAMADYATPGLAYLTPRGLRVMHILEQDVSDEHAYEELVEAVAERVLHHLGEFGVPLWREGLTGLRLDRSSYRPWQAMRLPLPGERVVLTGRDCEVCETDFQGGGVHRLSLDLALPEDLARACRQIAAWVQIAPEIVVTGLMALASAVIGNTRWIVARGRAHPLSLHYLTCLLSGSGKGEVRRYLRRATEDLEREVLARRDQARREQEDYRERLAEWRSDGRAERKRTTRGPRPEPPSLLGAGGERVSFIVSEGNLEGVVATLEDTPRGFLWASDEAHEVLGMLGRYGEGGSGRSLDAARLRRLMDSAPVEAHRARSNSSPVRHLPRPWLAIDADVQPRLLSQLFNGEDRASGLTARLLVHAPPPLQGKRKYLEAPPEPDSRMLINLQTRFETLWAHEQEVEDGVPQYEALHLDREAERLWAKELERLERLHAGAGEEETGTLGHARGRILRLAGVLTLLRDPDAMAVTTVDMRRAIVHMRYHLSHHRQLLDPVDEEKELQRLENLRGQLAELLKKQPEIGVRATDLRRHVSKKRYGDKRGLCRAYADLHALGWSLLRRNPPKGRSGRPPVPAFFPPGGGPHHPQGPAGSSQEPNNPPEGGFGGLGDAPERDQRRARVGGADTRELLDRASGHLLSTEGITLPRPGVRAACPACGSPDGLGVLPDDPRRWYCHSDRHGGVRSGCAVDYYLARQLGRMPSVQEAIEEAKQILDMNGKATSGADMGDGRG